MTGGFFYWQFNVGSTSQMRNKEALSLFICKTSIMKFITYSTCIEKEGG